MKRSDFLLLMSINGFLKGLGMILVTKKLLAVDDIPIDKYTLEMMRAIGFFIFGLSIITFLVRKSGNAPQFKAVLIGVLFIFLSLIALTLYEKLIISNPTSTSFWIDLAIRIFLTLGIIYYLVTYSRWKPKESIE